MFWTSLLYAPQKIKLVKEKRKLISDNAIIVKPIKAAICGSDVTLFNSGPQNKNKPITMGHEWFGRIIGGGSKKNNFKVGDIVTSEVFWGCGRCQACKMQEDNLCNSPFIFGFNNIGAFSEEICIPANRIINIPTYTSDLPLHLLEPLSIGLKSVDLILKQIPFPKKIAIIGSGGIGICIADVFTNKYGLKVDLFDMSDTKIILANKMGFKCYKVTEDNNFLDRFTNCYEVVVNATREERSPKLNGPTIAFKFVKKRGIILLVSKFDRTIKIDLNKFSSKESLLLGIKGVNRKYLIKAVKDIEKRERQFKILGGIFTNEFSLEQIQSAFKLSREREIGKITIKL